MKMNKQQNQVSLSCKKHDNCLYCKEKAAAGTCFCAVPSLTGSLVSKAVPRFSSFSVVSSVYD